MTSELEHLIPDDLSTATTTQSETPTADAAQSAANYITGALAAAQPYVNRRIRAEDSAAGQDVDPIQAARAIYAPMLGRDRGRQASSSVAMAAWQAALPFSAQYRDAARAAGRAEDRLKVLHPDAMARYAALRNGLDPVAAMREVAPLIGREIDNPQARDDYAVMLGQNEGRDATSEQALRAWEAAHPLREHIPDADTATSRAEDRLRELHPEAMAKFDTLRLEHSPAEAARQAARLVDPAYVSSIPEPSPAMAPQQNGPDPAPAQDAPGPATMHAQQRYADAVNAALPPEIAAAVLADKAWPRLAEALERAEHGGANAADLLATVAGKREIDTTKSTALVLTHRVDHHTPEDAATAASPADNRPPTTDDHTDTSTPATEPVADDAVAEPATGPAQVATATAAQEPAEIAARSFPVPITEATVPAGEDLATVDAAAALTREAALLTDAARDSSATPDDRATPLIDEHQDGRVQAAGLDMRSASVDAQAQALTESAPARFFQPIRMSGDRSTAGPGGTSTAAVAAQNFATPRSTRPPQQRRPRRRRAAQPRHHQPRPPLDGSDPHRAPITTTGAHHHATATHEPAAACHPQPRRWSSPRRTSLNRCSRPPPPSSRPTQLRRWRHHQLCPRSGAVETRPLRPGLPISRRGQDPDHAFGQHRSGPPDGGISRRQLQFSRRQMRVEYVRRQWMTDLVLGTATDGAGHLSKHSVVTDHAELLKQSGQLRSDHGFVLSHLERRNNGGGHALDDHTTPVHVSILPQETEHLVGCRAWCCAVGARSRLKRSR